MVQWFYRPKIPNGQGTLLTQPPLTQSTHWQAVSPAYRSLLRVHETLFSLFLLVALSAAYWFLGDWLGLSLFFGLFILLLVGYVTGYFVVCDRRARRLKYQVREHDFNVQMGVMVWKQLSVSFNRIQHLEVTQGPIERAFGLATLSVYSAGTHGSDVRLPGLGQHRAYELKSRLLATINAEPVESNDE